MKRFLFLALVLTGGCGDSGDDGVAVASGPDPFDDTVLATFEIAMDAAEWELMTADLRDNTWRRCTVAWRGETYPDVGIHPAGQSSRAPAHRRKPSLWLSFKEFVPGREFHGYERVKLDAMADDPAMVRERLAYPVYALRGVPAPRGMHCRLEVNGRYVGLYLLEERVNKEFVTKRFGRTTLNQLYRWSSAQPDFVYDASWAPSAYAGPEGTFPMWETRIETLPADAEAVKDLLRSINTDPAGVSTVFDVDGFLNLMAVEVATGETDGYIGNNFTHPSEFYTGNLFLHRNPLTGRYLLIVWDRDQSFWRPHEIGGPSYDESITFGFAERIATRKLILDVPARLASYKQYLRELVDGPLHPDRLNARLDFIVNQIRDAAFTDPNRLLAPTNEQLQGEWDHELRPRFSYKRELILRQLSSP